MSDDLALRPQSVERKNPVPEQLESKREVTCAAGQCLLSPFHPKACLHFSGRADLLDLMTAACFEFYASISPNVTAI